MSQFKFRLMGGKHTDSYLPSKGEGKPKQRIISKGEIFESDKPLHKLHNKPGQRPRFQLITGGTPTSVDEVPEEITEEQLAAEIGKDSEEIKDFSDMTKPELIAYAEAEEIDIEGLTLKADILAAIEESV